MEGVEGVCSMNDCRIAIIVGSLRRESFNRKFANALAKLAPSNFSFQQQPQIGDLPLYNQHDDASQAAVVKRLKAEIAAAQGLLFVTPEYNRSIPGVFKNAIDHASRPYGQSAWAGKPAGVIGVSPGAIGRRSLSNTRATFSLTLMCQHSANQKYSSRQKMVCSTTLGTLVRAASSSCKTGWTGMPAGSKYTPLNGSV
jgi:NAD(P)H-dependent FMN reductase